MKQIYQFLALLRYSAGNLRFKTHLRKAFLSFMALFCVFTLFSQQVLVNKEWEQSFGSPSNIDWSSSVLDGGGNIVTTGNSVVSSTNVALLLTKQNPDGTILWQKQFSIANDSKNYGVALTTDAANNIYVVGTCYISDANGKYNMLMIKYNSAGTKLWHKTYNGTGNDDDSAVSVICNSSGSEVYLTGPSNGLNSQADYMTLKLNGSTGATIWSHRYNYTANLQDIPIAISFDGTNKIIVAGGSASNAFNYDVLTLKYTTSGDLIDNIRVENPGNGFDQPSALFKDNAGNMYITGSTTADGVNFDILTIKLNNTLDLVWKKTYDLNGLEDRATSVCVDPAGNVYVTGFSTMDNITKTIIVLKYTASGILVWDQKFGEDEKETLARKGLLDAAGNLILAGVVRQETNSYWVTLQYDADGFVKWVKKGEETNGLDDKPTDIKVDAQGNVYVSGIKEEGGESAYGVIKYETLIRDRPIAYDANGDASHIANEIIVKFNPDFISTEFVDDKDRVYGDITEVLAEPALSNVSSLLGSARAKFVKVFKKMTTNNDISISRLNEAIQIPEFWSTFVLVLPDEVDIDYLMAGLNNLDEYLYYAHLNHVFTADNFPNDEYFQTEQASLTPNGIYNDANINMNPAWDIETGQDYIKVGILDVPVFWKHEDFGDGTYAGSIIKGGSDYVNDLDLESIESPLNSHGTACAGIIGALRNNEIGIAGIAGGGLDGKDRINNGVSLFSLAIDDGGFGSITTDNIIAAIVEGATSFDPTTGYGFGLHVMNFSISSNLYTQSEKEALNYCYRNKCVFVCSRGNAGTDAVKYPACYDDRLVMSIGASGINGAVMDGTNGNLWLSMTEQIAVSSYGNNMDLIAPGCTELVTTLINPDHKFTDFVNGEDLHPAPFGNQNSYQSFDGTSAAAPHVAGVAALLCSRHSVEQGYENNLAPEDVEYIIERYAKDVVGTNNNYPVGPDEKNGWGLLDAGACLEVVDAPEWRIFHSGAPDQLSDILVEQTPFGVGGLILKRYQTTHIYHNIFPEGTQIKGSWSRRSSTTGLGILDDGSFDDEFQDWASFNFDYQENDNEATVTIQTYRYEVVNLATDEILHNIPDAPIQTAYSLHLFESNTLSIPEILANQNIEVIPNPSTGVFNLSAIHEGVVKLCLFDINGKKLLDRELNVNENNSITLDISDFVDGIYVCRLSFSNNVKSILLIKQ